MGEFLLIILLLVAVFVGGGELWARYLDEKTDELWRRYFSKPIISLREYHERRAKAVNDIPDIDALHFRIRHINTSPVLDALHTAIDILAQPFDVTPPPEHPNLKDDIQKLFEFEQEVSQFAQAYTVFAFRAERIASNFPEGYTYSEGGTFFTTVGAMPALREFINKQFYFDHEFSPMPNRVDTGAMQRAVLDAPISITLTNRTQHIHIVGGTGHGKTQLIQYMVAKDLDEDCTVIVIDSQRQMIPKLAYLDMPLDDVTYLNPRWNLGINLFDVGYENLSEAEVNATVELLQYVLGAMIDADFTPKQQLIFQYAIQLCVSVPEGNIHTFLKILEDHNEYSEYIDHQPYHVRQFFDKEFGDRQYRDTKREISWRIWSMLKNPTFARIFSAIENPVDMYAEMEDSKLILIDTDIDLLHSASGFFGRVFIAQILQSAQRRFRGDHRPVYLYIDEAHQYFDRNLTTMLETARKANIGLILAHQDLGQLGTLRSTIMSNTATKFAGGVSAEDARAMAGALYTTPDFIREQPELTFATYIKGQGTYSVKVPAGVIENMPKRSSLTELCSEMEGAYGVTEHPPIPEPEDDDEEIRPGGKL